MALTKNLLMENAGSAGGKTPASSAQTAAPSSDANPMAFFKKPSDTEQPAAPSSQNEDTKSDEEESGNGQSSGNPMSFFAKKRAEG